MKTNHIQKGFIDQRIVPAVRCNSGFKIVRNKSIMKTIKIMVRDQEFIAVVHSALYAGFVAYLEDDTEENAHWGYTEQQAITALTEAIEENLWQH